MKTIPLTCGVCGQCVLCRIAKKDQRYAVLFGITDPSTIPEARTPSPPVDSQSHEECDYFSPGVSYERRRELRLAPGKAWGECSHPDRPSLVAESQRRSLTIAPAHETGSPVCPCQGCGPRCPGYTA